MVRTILSKFYKGFSLISFAQLCSTSDYIPHSVLMEINFIWVQGFYGQNSFNQSFAMGLVLSHSRNYVLQMTTTLTLNLKK